MRRAGTIQGGNGSPLDVILGKMLLIRCHSRNDGLITGCYLEEDAFFSGSILGRKG